MNIEDRYFKIIPLGIFHILYVLWNNKSYQWRAQNMHN